MFTRHIAHRIFLTVIVIVCVTAVVLLVKQKADASLTPITSSTNIGNVAVSATSPTDAQSAPVTTVAPTATQTATSSVQLNPQQVTDPKTTTSISTTTATSTSAQGSSKTVENTTQDVKKSSGQNYAVTATLQDSGAIKQPASSVSEAQQNAIQNAVQTSADNPSQIIAEPIVIAAKNLSKENNPKLSGVVSSSLRIEKVLLTNKQNGNKVLALSGKSEANAIVVIYIFSNDPVVISIKADANGAWSYELDKELADGQHEAFVTVADDSGKIVSKSEPIAFVKTAEAASVIPLSAFNDNQSPIENSAQQFVLMAIIAMSICLVIALVLIGYLTHKRNLNEASN